MLSLKKLHESLIQEEIKQNYFLHTLNEAIKKGTVDELNGLLSEIGKLIGSTNIKSLKIALIYAQADNKKVPYYRDSREAEKTILKIITFYSKIWNFFNEDIDKIIEKIPSDHKKNTPLNASSAADSIKSLIERLMIEDNSPWYKKALSAITSNISFASEIPYLNVVSFVDEIMSKTKEELLNIMLMASVIKPPSVWHDRISTSILAPDTGGAVTKAPTASTASTKTVPIPLTVLRTSSPATEPTASPQTVAARSQRVEMPAFDINTLSPEQKAQLSLSPTAQKTKSPVLTQVTPIQATAPRSQRVEMPAVDPAQLTKSVKTQPGFAQLPTEEPGQTVQKIRRKTTTVLEAKLLKKIKQKLKVYQSI